MGEIIREIERLLLEVVTEIKKAFFSIVNCILRAIRWVVVSIIRLIRKIIKTVLQSADFLDSALNRLLIIYGASIISIVGYLYMGERSLWELVYGIFSGFVSTVLLILTWKRNASLKDRQDDRQVRFAAIVFVIFLAAISIFEFLDSITAGVVSLLIAAISALKIIEENDRKNFKKRIFLSLISLALFGLLIAYFSGFFGQGNLSFGQNKEGNENSQVSPAPENNCNPGKIVLTNQDKSGVKKLQMALKSDKKIYPRGYVTGNLAKHTEEAIEAFQRQYNLPTTGTVDECTFEKIKQVFPDFYRDEKN